MMMGRSLHATLLTVCRPIVSFMALFPDCLFGLLLAASCVRPEAGIRGIVSCLIPRASFARDVRGRAAMHQGGPHAICHLRPGLVEGPVPERDDSCLGPRATRPRSLDGGDDVNAVAVE